MSISFNKSIEGRAVQDGEKEVDLFKVVIDEVQEEVLGRKVEPLTMFVRSNSIKTLLFPLLVREMSFDFSYVIRCSDLMCLPEFRPSVNVL
jgi:hypothetical protein